jgi:hypothetical protein
MPPLGGELWCYARLPSPYGGGTGTINIIDNIIFDNWTFFFFFFFMIWRFNKDLTSEVQAKQGMIHIHMTMKT